jgi:hypothetical protein
MSEIKVDKISPQSGTALQIGDASDVITIPASATITNLGTATGFGGGKILQVLQTAKTDTASIASVTFADISGLSQAITPSAASSKILVSANVTLCGQSGVGGHFQLVRDSTAIGIGDAAGSRTRCTVGSRDITNPSEARSMSMQYLDSPSTTSATTYKVQWRCQNASYTQWIGRTYDDGDNAAYGRYMTSITVMEIGA